MKQRPKPNEPDNKTSKLRIQTYQCRKQERELKYEEETGDKQRAKNKGEKQGENTRPGVGEKEEERRKIDGKI